MEVSQTNTKISLKIKQICNHPKSFFTQSKRNHAFILNCTKSTIEKLLIFSSPSDGLLCSNWLITDLFHLFYGGHQSEVIERLLQNREEKKGNWLNIKAITE